ncbi:MAG TPA: LamG-like jellyroll fold domain-containing protein [Roseiarcus sp.]
MSAKLARNGLGGSLVGLGLLFAVRSWADPVPILQYNFNEGGGATANSTGSDKTPLTMRDKSFNLPTDYHGGSGSGVTNAKGDNSFYNRPLGADKVTGYADEPFVAAIDKLVSFTLTAWIAPSPQPIPATSVESLFFKFDSGAGFVLQAIPGGGAVNAKGFGLSLSVNGGTSSTLSIAYPYTAYDFIAVTYDGTAAADNVNFYLGLRGSGDTSEVTLVSTKTINQGQVGAVNKGLTIGSMPRGNSPFLGLMDDVNIFGTTKANDASGVLSLAQLETLRKSELAVPEPSSLVLVGTGLFVIAGIGAASRRRPARQPHLLVAH